MVRYDGIVFALQAFGGISVLFTELLCRLDRRGCDFDLARFSDNGPAFGGRLVQYAPRYGERFRSAEILGVQPCQIFHSTYYRLPSQSCKVVTTVHDFTYERFVRGPRRWVHSRQKNAAIRGADKVICVSNSTRADLLELLPDVSEDRIEVVPNGVSEVYRPLADGRLRTDDYVLFVGSRSRYKNFHAVVTALSGFRGLSLWCVGGGALAADERRVLEKNLPGRWLHAGQVDESKLNELYNDAFCLVYPSLYEGFGIPVLEAMRAGCPVIAVDSSSIPEVAGDAAILLDRGDPDEIRSALERLRSGALRTRYIRAGLARAQLFSWDETFQGTVRVYEELLGRQICDGADAR
jgi:mannosyltransferase